MGHALGRTASEVGCSERTLRRYVNEGLLRGRRLGGRVELTAQEERYLRSHHRLLLRLMAALRTERDVRLAVLFGSAATGADRPDSDVDLLIAHRRGVETLARVGLARRLSRTLGRHVQLVTLADAERSPSLLADAVVLGRVLVDRDGLWKSLPARREELLAKAAREEAETLALAHKAADEARARAYGG